MGGWLINWFINTVFSYSFSFWFSVCDSDGHQERDISAGCFEVRRSGFDASLTMSEVAMGHEDTLPGTYLSGTAVITCQML